MEPQGVTGWESKVKWKKQEESQGNEEVVPSGWQREKLDCAFLKNNPFTSSTMRSSPHPRS